MYETIFYSLLSTLCVIGFIVTIGLVSVYCLLIDIRNELKEDK